MKNIGYLVKNKVESKKVWKYFFNKGVYWKYKEKGEQNIIIGNRGSVIYEDCGRLNYWVCQTKFELMKISERVEIKEFNNRKLKI